MEKVKDHPKLNVLVRRRNQIRAGSGRGILEGRCFFVMDSATGMSECPVFSGRSLSCTTSYFHEKHMDE